MAATKLPKVLLFDIGGVCVGSPFQSILDYELGLGIPPGWVNHAISRSGPDGFWHRLETGSIPMDADFFAGFNRELHDPAKWQAFYQTQRAQHPHLPDISPMPRLDGEWLLNDMMSASRTPDPWMFPALKSLRADGRYVLAALSNTVIWPAGHAYALKVSVNDRIKSLFDVSIFSAHVGLRKPDPKIYELALKEVNDFARTNAHTERGRVSRWAEGVLAEEVVFLDDIGQNLKAARAAGFKTIKVNLGRTFEAVDALESITGLKLAGDHPKIAMKL